MTAQFPPFRPRWPWLGADLQTLRNFLRGPLARPDPARAERREFAMDDGSGDRLVGFLDPPALGSGRPLAVLVHGLTGCSDSAYILGTAACLSGRGYAVLRLNLRGAMPTRALCSGHYHAGRSADLAAVLGHIAAPVVVVGFSLGANMLLKYLGEAGHAASSVVAAASVSAPIELAPVSRRIMAPRNLVYHRYLLGRMRQEALHERAALTPVQRAAARTAPTIYDYDDRVVAPSNGFADAEDYYRRSSAAQFLPSIRVPTLVVHALDDPWIPGALYRRVGWRANPSLVPLLPERGGHVGFHGRGASEAWHDRCIAAFFDDVVGVQRPDASARAASSAA